MASISFAVGGGGGGSNGGSSSSGSGCAGLCELECLDNGAVRFLAANEIANLTAAYGNETFPVTGYWSFNRFTSDEVLFNKKGRYVINGYPVDCPGLRFSCLLAKISIARCIKQQGYVEAEFTARNFDSLNKIKYEFLAGGRSFFYTYTLKSGQVYSFSITNISNITYFINASIAEDIDTLRISDSRCAAKTAIECSQSRHAVQTRTFFCNDLGTLPERVSCRLALTEEQRYTELRVNFLPEECRAMDGAQRDECVRTYDSVQGCWKFAEGEPRVNCVKDVIGFTNISAEKRNCTDVSDKAACTERIRKNVFTLVKFRFYDLEERAEEFYERDPELVAKAVADFEKKKQEFNSAKTLGEKKDVVLQVRAIWKDFMREING